MAEKLLKVSTVGWKQFLVYPEHSWLFENVKINEIYSISLYQFCIIIRALTHQKSFPRALSQSSVASPLSIWLKIFRYSLNLGWFLDPSAKFSYTMMLVLYSHPKVVSELKGGKESLNNSVEQHKISFI